MSLNPEQLESHLLQLMVPDTNQIKQTELFLKSYIKNDNHINNFIILIERSTHPQVRQLGCTLLRKKFNKKWNKIKNTGLKNQIKEILLNRLLSEDTHLVRKSLCNLIATIAKHLLPNNHWPELLNFINDCAQSQNEIHREISMMLFYSLTETVGEYLKPHFKEIKLLFARALQDTTSMKVRMMAMKASTFLLSYLNNGSDDTIHFLDLVPLMIDVLKLCIANNNELDAVEFFNIFNDLAEEQAPVLNPYISILVHFILQVMLNENLELTTRNASACVLDSLIESKPKAIGKTPNLIRDIFDVLLRIIAKDTSSAGGMLSSMIQDESDDSNNNEDDDDDQVNSSTRMAQRTMDMVALYVPSKYIHQLAMQMASDALASNDNGIRKAGIIMLGVIVEGCAELFRNQLHDILSPIYLAGNDSDPLIRESCCFALGQFAEHLQPDILDHSEQLLPVVFHLLDDASPSVKATSCYVLENFTESLEPERILPFLEPLMNKLVSLVQTSKPQIQIMAISAIGSTAIGAEENFIPYFPHICKLLEPLLSIQDSKYYTLRGRSLECMGYMAIAVGKEVYKNYLDNTMSCAIHACQILQDMELCDYSFAFFCNASKAFGKDFQPYLEKVMPLLSHAIKMDDGMKMKNGVFDTLDESDQYAAAFNEDDEEDEDHEEDDHLNKPNEDDDNNKTILSVRTSMLDMKVGAVGCIESLAEFTGGCFEPYILVSMELLAGVKDYFHESVRSAALSALAQVLAAAVDAHPLPSKWIQGQPEGIAVHELITRLLPPVVQAFNEAMDESEAIEVEKALDGLTKLSLLLGPMVTWNTLPNVMPLVNSIFQNDHICQLSGESDPECEEDISNNNNIDDEDETEHAGSVLASACEFITSQAKAFGNQFLPFFHELFPNLIRFTKSIRPAKDRGTVLGCIAEILHEFHLSSNHNGQEKIVSTQFHQYVIILLPIIIRSLNDGDDNIKQNAAFCLGTLAEISSQKNILTQKDYQNMLHALRPLFELNIEIKNGIRDNACAALARMIMADLQYVPLEHVLPIFLSSLPLKNDITENNTVFTCLLGLIQQQNQYIMKYIDKILYIFIDIFIANENQYLDNDDPIYNQIIVCTKQLISAYSDTFQLIYHKLDRTNQEIISNKLR